MGGMVRNVLSVRVEWRESRVESRDRNGSSAVEYREKGSGWSLACGEM